MNKGFRSGLKLVTFLFAAAFALGLAAQPLAAQVTIPQGSTINTATFSVFTPYVSNQTVYVHRVTAGWGELSVTWANFADQFDSAYVGRLSLQSRRCERARARMVLSPRNVSQCQRFRFRFETTRCAN